MQKKFPGGVLRCPKKFRKIPGKNTIVRVFVKVSAVVFISTIYRFARLDTLISLEKLALW